MREVAAFGGASDRLLRGLTRSTQTFGSPHSSQMLPLVPPPHPGQPPETSTS